MKNRLNLKWKNEAREEMNDWGRYRDYSLQKTVKPLDPGP